MDLKNFSLKKSFDILSGVCVVIEALGHNTVQLSGVCLLTLQKFFLKAFLYITGINSHLYP